MNVCPICDLVTCICPPEGDEPNGVGFWMIEETNKWKVKNRIACPERGYYASEALYANIEEWEHATGGSFDDFVDMI